MLGVGQILHMVNGVEVRGHAAATELIKAAVGDLTLVVSFPHESRLVEEAGVEASVATADSAAAVRQRQDSHEDEDAMQEAAGEGTEQAGNNTTPEPIRIAIDNSIVKMKALREEFLEAQQAREVTAGEACRVHALVSKRDTLWTRVSNEIAKVLDERQMDRLQQFRQRTVQVEDAIDAARRACAEAKREAPRLTPRTAAQKRIAFCALRSLHSLSSCTVCDTGKEGVQVVSNLAHLLESCGYTEVKPVAKARIPVVKCVSAEGMSCDIVYENRLAAHNTKLLHTYATACPTFRSLAILVKYWARARALLDSPNGGLSSYATVLSVLHFLQVSEARSQPCCSLLLLLLAPSAAAPRRCCSPPLLLLAASLLPAAVRAHGRPISPRALPPLAAGRGLPPDVPRPPGPRGARAASSILLRGSRCPLR